MFLYLCRRYGGIREKRADLFRPFFLFGLFLSAGLLM